MVHGRNSDCISHTGNCRRVYRWNESKYYRKIVCKRSCRHDFCCTCGWCCKSCVAYASRWCDYRYCSILRIECSKAFTKDGCGMGNVCIPIASQLSYSFWLWTSCRNDAYYGTIVRHTWNNKTDGRSLLPLWRWIYEFSCTYSWNLNGMYCCFKGPI